MTTPKLCGVLHPVIVTRDMPNALTFYRDLLGFRLKSEMVHDASLLARLGGPSDADASAAILEAPDGSEIEVACFASPGGKARSDTGWPDAGIRSITFIVEGLAEMLSRTARVGYPAAGDVVPFSVDGETVRVAYVNGPDGVVLTLVEREKKP